MSYLKRVYLDKKDCYIDTNSLEIKGDTRHYLCNVLRVKNGDTFLGFDGSGCEYEVSISCCTKKIIVGIIKNLSQIKDIELPFHLTLFQSVPKSDKMGFIIREVSQLGISRVVPVISQRVVGVTLNERLKSKTERWRKISAASSSLAGRRFVTEISSPVDFKETLKLDIDILILFWEGQKGFLRKELSKHIINKKFSSVGIFIGPEGGFSSEEVELATQNGVIIASLGQRILKVETASVIATSIIIYELENSLSEMDS
jgi:16S rRNA (uracil1498-N3)-methyltransferase